MNTLRKRILIVDDEPVITRGIRRILELTGEHEVREENHGSHAMAAAKAFLPDLILLDVRMPEVEGGELASEFRSVPEFREIPIVFLTALVTQEEVNGHGGYIGGERFLAKPVDPVELMNCLREQLGKHASHSLPGRSAEMTDRPGHPGATAATEDAKPHLAY